MKAFGEEIASPLLGSGVGVEDPVAGLSSSAAAARLLEYGRNEVPVEKPSKLRVFLRQFEGPMPMMLMLACVMSAAVTDWEDFGIIAAMLLLNASIAFVRRSPLPPPPFPLEVLRTPPYPNAPIGSTRSPWRSRRWTRSRASSGRR